MQWRREDQVCGQVAFWETVQSQKYKDDDKQIKEALDKQKIQCFVSQ